MDRHMQQIGVFIVHWYLLWVRLYLNTPNHQNSVLSDCPPSSQETSEVEDKVGDDGDDTSEENR